MPESFILDWPFPPSVNSLYDGGHKTHRRFKSDTYKDWLRKLQGTVKVRGLAIFTNPCKAIYTLQRPDKRRRDVANYEKAVSDALVKHGVLSDDTLIEEITLKWGEAPQGVRVEIMEIVD